MLCLFHWLHQVVGQSPSCQMFGWPGKYHRQHVRLRGHENVTGIVACSGIDGYYMNVEDNYEMESMVGLWLSLMMI